MQLCRLMVPPLIPTGLGPGAGGVAAAGLQGGRWMDSSNMPCSLASQLDQPEVKQALVAAQDPDKKRELEHKQAARAAAQGGRWLD
jgi:hypothetical protein